MSEGIRSTADQEQVFCLLFMKKVSRVSLRSKRRNIDCRFYGDDYVVRPPFDWLTLRQAQGERVLRGADPGFPSPRE